MVVRAIERAWNFPSFVRRAHPSVEGLRENYFPD
jgi:hypothetical protein